MKLTKSCPAGAAWTSTRCCRAPRRRGNPCRSSFRARERYAGTKCGKRLPAEAFGGNRLLRVVEPLAIGVLRTHHHRARRPRGRDAMAGNCTVHSKHVAIVAQHLKIIGSPVARGREAFVVAAVGRFRWRSSRGWQPKQLGVHESVAGVAGHAALLAVRELRLVLRDVAPSRRRCARFLRDAIFRVVPEFRA